MGVEKTVFCGGGQKKSFPLKLAATRVREESLHCTFNIGHFPVPPGLCFKRRVSAQPWIWKSSIKLIFTRKSCAPSLILKARVFGTSRKWPIITVRDLFGGLG